MLKPNFDEFLSEFRQDFQKIMKSAENLINIHKGTRISLGNYSNIWKFLMTKKSIFEIIHFSNWIIQSTPRLHPFRPGGCHPWTRRRLRGSASRRRSATRSAWPVSRWSGSSASWRCNKDTNEKMKWKMKFSHKFRKFLAFSECLSHFSAKSQYILSFPDNFCEIPGNFHQNFAEKSQNSSKNANEKWNFIFIPAKIWTFFRWNFEM